MSNKNLSIGPVINIKTLKLYELRTENNKLQKQVEGMKKDTDMWLIREKELEAEIEQLKSRKLFIDDVSDILALRNQITIGKLTELLNEKIS